MFVCNYVLQFVRNYIPNVGIYKLWTYQRDQVNITLHPCQYVHMQASWLYNLTFATSLTGNVLYGVTLAFPETTSRLLSSNSKIMIYGNKPTMICIIVY